MVPGLKPSKVRNFLLLNARPKLRLVLRSHLKWLQWLCQGRERQGGDLDHSPPSSTAGGGTERDKRLLPFCAAGYREKFFLVIDQPNAQFLLL